MGSFLAETLLQVVGAVLEVPVRALGYGVLRYCLARPQVAWASHAVLIVGVIEWLVLFVLGYKVWDWVLASS